MGIIWCLWGFSRWTKFNCNNVYPVLKLTAKASENERLEDEHPFGTTNFQSFCCLFQAVWVIQKAFQCSTHLRNIQIQPSLKRSGFSAEQAVKISACDSPPIPHPNWRLLSQRFSQIFLFQVVIVVGEVSWRFKAACLLLSLSDYSVKKKQKPSKWKLSPLKRNIILISSKAVSMSFLGVYPCVAHLPALNIPFKEVYETFQCCPIQPPCKQAIYSHWYYTIKTPTSSTEQIAFSTAQLSWNSKKLASKIHMMLVLW